MWVSDASIKESDAGNFINHAIADQWKIVRSVDPRPNPPATLTLWFEGSKLMQQGKLTVPPGTVLVFADEGSSYKFWQNFERLRALRITSMQASITILRFGLRARI